MIQDFLTAALPWIAIGVAVAIFFASQRNTVHNNNGDKNYVSMGIAIGMCFGVAFSCITDMNMGLGIAIGMVLGLSVGTSLEKKNKR
ncbi:MAG: hypothetical protein Q4C49_05540 [Bacillota bacterium]|nr:hypothetical protein [Bacillota bacterium]